MPTGYRIHQGAGLVLFGGAGPLTVEAWRGTVEEALTDPGYHSGFRLLSDRRRLEQGYSTAAIHQMVEHVARMAPRLGRTQWAVLTKDRGADFGMVRMAEILAEASPVEIQAFSELRDALRWLYPGFDEKLLAALTDWVEQHAGGG